MTSRTVRVGLVGARGHVGAELVQMLASMPDVDVRWMTSETRAGELAKDSLAHAPSGLAFSAPDPHARLAESVDVVFLGLPNGHAASWVRAIDEVSPKTVVVDLSADHRFDDRFVYGLAARQRDRLRRTQRIANPGCYATAMALAIDPLVIDLVGPAVAFGVSGTSGAGTAPNERNDRSRIEGGVLPYGLVDHVHEREVSRELGRQVRLLPHVGPFFRGISVTIAAEVRRPTSRAEMFERVAGRYADEPLVHVTTDLPRVQDASGKHGVWIGGIDVGRDRRNVTLVATIDNLLGGAATNAVRNMNLALGRDELSGIPEEERS